MSSFQTVGRIERLRSYAAAQARYETTKPIRGSDNLRPLGDRRDAARYYIRQEGAGEYCAYLYNTPVVTFYPNDEIVIATDGHDTALSIDFIGQVLGIPASRTRGQCVFTVDGTKYVTSGRNGKLVLQSNQGRFTVTERQAHKQYVVSRSEANNVRRKYSEFRAYLKGFLSLRTQSYTFHAAYRGMGDEVRELVEISREELVDNLGVIEQNENWSGSTAVNSYVRLKNVQHLSYKRDDLYVSNNELFDLLIQNGQADEHKTANFYKACVMLVAAVSAISSPSIPLSREYIRAEPKAIAAMLDEIQFKWFSKDVFVLADVPAGKVPTHKYNSWVESPSGVNFGHVPQTKA